MAIDQTFKDMVGDREDGQSLFDFILAEDEADTGQNWMGLVATSDQDYKEQRVPVLGQRISEGRFTLDDRDPQSHLVWRQDDWSDGALIDSTAQSNKGYLTGNMDAAFPGVVGPGIAKNFGSSRGNTRQPIGWLLRNPHFESDSDDGWSDDSGANGTVDMQATDDFRSTLLGSQSCKVTWTGTTANVDVISQSLSNPTVYQGASLTVACYFKKSAGSGGIQIEIDDGVGTTRGTGVTSASDWTLVTATRTINGSASEVTITIETENTSTFTGHIDDFTVYSGATTADPTRIAVLDDGDIYTFAGRIVAKLDTSTADEFKWDAVYVHASAVATDIIAYRNSAGTAANHIYVAFGSQVAYIYGSDTTWTVSTLTGDAKFAVYWTKSRTTLWKSEDSNEIRSATNPLNGGSWSSIYTVGETNHPITALYGFADTVVAGKEDGLWVYRRVYNDGTSADLFENKTQELDRFPNEFHFKGGHHFPADDSLYLPVGGSGGLLRLNSSLQLSDASRLVLKPESFIINGKVYTVTSDPFQMWLFVDDQLLSASYDERGRMKLHMRAEAPSVSPAALASSGTTSFDTGWLSPSTGANFDNGGAADWSSPGQISTSNNAYAIAAGSKGTTTQALRATQFGASIPSAAIITGVEMRFERQDSGSVKDSDVRLLKAGTETGTNKADTGTTWPATDTVSGTYGSSTDLWGASWIPSDINNSNFGVSIAADNLGGAENAAVDHIELKIYYTLSSSSSRVLLPKASSTVNWDIAGVATPHLLGVYAGQDSTDNLPYVITDCWALPDEGLSPMNDSADLPASPSTQTFYTSRWDADAPTEKKVASHLEVLMRDNDSTQPFAVKFGVDGADHTSASLGTLNEATSVQTLYFGDVTDFATATVFRDIGLYFEGTITGSKQKAKFKAFELHAYPIVEILKLFTIKVQVGGAMLHNGSNQDDVTDPSQLQTDIEAFENREATFYLIEDMDRDGIPTSHPVVMRAGSLVKTPSQGGSQWEMVFQSTLAIN